jgi:hypothetical protein
VNKAKPFCISKWEVWEAYKLIRANRGAARVDGQSIAELEENLKDNLYKIWNRMSSGSYFPPSVRRVDIPMDNGNTNGGGPHCPDGSQTIPGADLGRVFPSGLLSPINRSIYILICADRSAWGFQSEIIKKLNYLFLLYFMLNF